MKSKIKKEKKESKKDKTLSKKRDRDPDKEVNFKENSFNKIIIQKKEIWNILNDIKLDDNLIIVKKNSEDFNSLNNNSSHHSIQNSSESNSSSSNNEEIKRPTFDAGSGSIVDKDQMLIKTEEQANGLEKTNILRLILNDIQQCQFSEIFKIFAKEINNPATLDYFNKLKDSLIKEDTEKLVNMIVFIVWSLRFMKVDTSLIRSGANLIVQQNSFTINEEINKDDEGNDDDFNNKQEDKNSNSGSISNNLYTPMFNNNMTKTQNIVNQTFGQSANKNSSSGSFKDNKEKVKLNDLNANNKLQEKDKIENNISNKLNVPVLPDFLTFPSSTSFPYAINPSLIPNQNFFNMPGNFLIPVSLYPSFPINFNTANMSLNNPSGIVMSSVDNSSCFKTEKIKSGQLFNNSNVQDYNTANTPNKHKSTYDQFISLNESNPNNTLSSLNNKRIVKAEIDLIDITVGEEKSKDEDFEKVYKEIVLVFSKPITDDTFVKLKSFMGADQVKKIEELVKKNPFSYLEKKLYILLFKSNKDELYLKIDPKLKKFSITRSVSRPFRYSKSKSD